jgi:hypothetical protein
MTTIVIPSNSARGRVQLGGNILRRGEPEFVESILLEALLLVIFSPLSAGDESFCTFLLFLVEERAGVYPCGPFSSIVIMY